jgi:acyl-CoA thioesterase
VTEFEEGTRVDAAGRGAIAVGWDIGGNANGGYLLALATSHMRAVSGRPDPISVSAQYLAPGSPGPVQVDATVVKAGKRFTIVRATMHRDGKPILEVLGSFGDVTANAGGFVHDSLVPVAIPPIEECVRRAPSQSGVEVPMMDRLDLRLRPSDVGFASGTPSGQAEVAGWFAFADGQPLDTLALLLVCDALPPSVFNLDGMPPGWVPTLEYTVHVRGRPAPGPVQCVFRTNLISDGFLEEDGEVRDSTGKVVAMSRQLALVARA